MWRELRAYDTLIIAKIFRVKLLSLWENMIIVI